MPARPGRSPRGAEAAAAPADRTGPSFVVEYADDPYAFSAGTRMRFGRDDEACQIPVWEQLNARALSKVAGELWCASGQMWVRNLSTAHELAVTGRAASRVLPARVGDDPGHACSVPSPRGTITAPSTGGWALVVRRVGGADGRAEDLGPAVGDRTLRVEDIPEKHRATAEALCAPLLDGSSTLPATYAQIAVARCWSERVARRHVDDLCAHYQGQVEALPGGRVAGETLAQAVARTLVLRGKFAVGAAGPEARAEPSGRP